MNSNTSAPTPIDIGFVPLVTALHAHRWLLAAMTLIGLLGGVAASLLVPKTYKAQVVLAPVSSKEAAPGGSVAAISSQLGSLASMAGLGGQSDSEKWEAVAVLQSQALVGAYLLKEEAVDLIESKKEATISAQAQVWNATQRFRERHMVVARDNKTGLVTLTVSWRDAAIAARWANGLVALTNQVARDKALAVANRNIEYLSSQARTAAEVETRQAIYSLLASEIRSAMLARGTDDFAFRVIDPALPPAKPAAPRPKLWVPAATAAGAVLGVILALLWDALRALRRESTRQRP